MALNPRFVGNLRFLAASLAANGQFKEAREVGRHLLGLTGGEEPDSPDSEEQDAGLSGPASGPTLAA